MNNLFHKSQHGFRAGFSCEAALHELISSFKLNNQKELVNILKRKTPNRIILKRKIGVKKNRLLCIYTIIKIFVFHFMVLIKNKI